tara:strand:+ start:165 stop:1265 length:1101 start_codon:yes stop_codon:yes gene_type:complete
VSATSPTEDKLASEVVHALREGFPYTEPVGIVGHHLERARVQVEGRVSDLKFGYFRGLKRRRAVKKTLEQIEKNTAKVVLIAGLNDFNRCLLKELKKSAFVLLTQPAAGLQPSDIKLLRDHCHNVLVMFAEDGEILGRSGIANTFIGFPYMSRLQSIKINPEDFNLHPSQIVVTFIPAYSADKTLKALGFLVKLSDSLKKERPEVLLLVPLPKGIDKHQVEQEIGLKVNEGHYGSFSVGNMKFLQEMPWEAMSLADLVISGGGVSCFESAIIGKPQICMKVKEFRTPLVHLLDSTAQIPEVVAPGHLNELSELVSDVLTNENARQTILDANASFVSKVEGLQYESLVEEFVEFLGRRSVAKRRAAR